MAAVAIIGCCCGGAVVGGLVGLLRPRSGADDLGIGAGFDMLGGAIGGGFLGMVVGAVVFA